MVCTVKLNPSPALGAQWGASQTEALLQGSDGVEEDTVRGNRQSLQNVTQSCTGRG